MIEYCTLWKLRKFTLTEKIFRQITYEHIQVVIQNRCFPEIFAKKKVRDSSVNTVWILREFSLTHFWRNFRENNGFI